MPAMVNNTDILLITLINLSNGSYFLATSLVLGP